MKKKSYDEAETFMEVETPFYSKIFEDENCLCKIENFVVQSIFHLEGAERGICVALRLLCLHSVLKMFPQAGEY